MAKHTITVSDEDGGISINLAREGSRDTIAGAVALALIEHAKDAVLAAVKAAAKSGSPCPCLKCQAERTANTSKPTLH